MSKSKLQNDFEMFRDHCIIIRRDYNTYNELFFSGSDEILAKTAASFFSDISEIMHRDWILQVCKLMDPATTKRKGGNLENLTIKLIDSQLENERLMAPEIKNLSRAVLNYGKKLTLARHKRLAHFDRAHQISGVVLGATTEKELEDFLDNLQLYCDEVGRAIDSGPLDFSSSASHGDVSDLLRILREYCGNA